MFPMANPYLADGRELPVPLGRKGVQGRFVLLKSRGLVNGLEVSSHRLALFLGDIAQAIAHQVNDPQLNLSVRIQGLNRLRKFHQSIAAGNQDVLESPIVQVGEHL